MRNAGGCDVELECHINSLPAFLVQEKTLVVNNPGYSGEFDISRIRVHELKDTRLEWLVADGNWMVFGTRIFSPGGISIKDSGGNVVTDAHGNPKTFSGEMSGGLAVHEGAHVWQFAHIGPGYMVYALLQHARDALGGPDPYELSDILQDRTEFHLMPVEQQAEFLQRAYERGIFKDLRQEPDTKGRDWTPRWNAHESPSEYYYFREAIADFQRRSPW